MSAPSVRDRVTVRNPETAAKLANAFVPDGQRDKVVLEAYPGPGALTRALLELPKERIRKIIIMEEEESYLQWLRPLAEYDSRVKLIGKRGLDWDTYQTIEDTGLMDDVQQVPWHSGVHPALQFIAHIPQTVQGEQLVSQIFRCMPDNSWLFKYGRVPLSLITNDTVWKRMSAGVDQKNQRCKMSVIAEAVSDFSIAVHPFALQPYDEHWHPMSSLRRVRGGTDIVACNITPSSSQAIAPGMLDKWDYVLRRLFVVKATPLIKAMGSLSPGAEVLLEPLTSRALPPDQRVDVSKPVRLLTLDDWTRIVKAFDEWPFAPKDLMITDGFSRDIEKD